jgi:DNA-directed RNA polymerase subunit RPC12/RpoP
LAAAGGSALWEIGRSSGRLFQVRKVSRPPLTIGERSSAKPERMALLVAGKKSVYQRGVVSCRKCATPIHFYRLQMLVEEFSVRCPHCGERALYAKREIGIEELPERRRKPRRER